MADRLTILQVNSYDVGGGAEKVAAELRRLYAEMGHESYIAVGHKRRVGHDVFQIRHGPWYNALRGVSDFLMHRCSHIRGAARLSSWAQFLAQPRGSVRARRGYDIPRYRDSAALLELPPRTPDVLHFHNLHGFAYGARGYFDMRALPDLSRQLPVVLTMHDAWLLSGHCAHSFSCDRWKTGCGQCPDLTIYPSIPVDRTAENWLERRDIYRDSRLYVATPSRWLMEKVQQSILAPGIVQARVIPNGIDLNVFKPGDRAGARAALGIDGLTNRTRILLFAANALRNNQFKDYATLRITLERLGERSSGSDLVLLALGDDGGEERIGGARLCFLPYENDPRKVARYYQAANIYVHPTKADTFPTTVIEALACGTPVVATAVGGIPEQVRSLLRPPGRSVEPTDLNRATGLLTGSGDAVGLSDALELLLTNDDMQRRLGENAAEDARVRFDGRQQARAYVEWYRAILQRETNAAHGGLGQTLDVT